MQISFLLLLVTCFLYGASGLITDWSDFACKLWNTIIIITIIVLFLIISSGAPGFFQNSDLWWVDCILPIPAICLGLFVNSYIENDDWIGVFGILGGLSLIATIITTCCGL